MHYFKLSPRNNKRSVLAALFYLTLLYGLIPMLAFAIKQPSVAKFFWPLLKNDATALNLIPALLNLAVAFALLYMRWVDINKFNPAVSSKAVVS